jgi:crossover junction endodeoxyribonuclease RusA
MSSEHIITLTIPYPPSVNHYYCKTKGRYYLAEPVITFRKAVWSIFKASGQKGFKDEELFCNVTVWLPDKRRRDIDNVLKGLFDSLQWAGCVNNDVWIKKLTIEILGIERGGSCSVSLSPLNH